MTEELDQVEPIDAGQAQFPPIPEAAFAALTNLLALVADQRAAKRQLRELLQQQTAATEGQAKLAADRAAFDAHESTVRADLTKCQAAVRGRELAVHVEEEGLRERQADLAARAAALDRENSILKRRIAVAAGFGHELDVPLRSPPTWKQIAGELLNAEQIDLVDEMETVAERVEHTPVDSTLRRTTYHPRARSSRRVSTEA